MAGTKIAIISGTNGQNKPSVGSIGITELTIIDLIDIARERYAASKGIIIDKAHNQNKLAPQLKYLGRNSITGPYMPSNLTADSEPDFDNWGPDDYWSCEAFLAWHQANEAKYGLAVANSRFKDAFEKAFTFGSYHQDCAYESTFRNYFRDKGIQIDTVGSFLVMTISDVLYNTADTATNVTAAASSVSKVIKVVAPIAAVIGLVWYSNKLYKDSQKG